LVCTLHFPAGCCHLATLSQYYWKDILMLMIYNFSDNWIIILTHFNRSSCIFEEKKTFTESMARFTRNAPKQHPNHKNVFFRAFEYSMSEVINGKFPSLGPLHMASISGIIQ
jgi:hypothetical protein